MRYEELDARKMSILKAIIDDYIASVEPVGSRTIARKYDMGLSSATIRNEMADLEEMGYLSQPHTSAGRIPSDKGYRLYVDKLMDPNEPVLKPTQEDLEAIRDFMQRRIHELNQMVRAASEIVSRITHYTATGCGKRKEARDQGASDPFVRYSQAAGGCGARQRYHQESDRKAGPAAFA